MGNLPLSGQGVTEAHDRDVVGIESKDERPTDKLAEGPKVDSSISRPPHSAYAKSALSEWANEPCHTEFADIGSGQGTAMNKSSSDGLRVSSTA